MNAVLVSIALSGHFLEAIVDKITWRESFDVVGDCFLKLFKVSSPIPLATNRAFSWGSLIVSLTEHIHLTEMHFWSEYGTTS